MPDGGCLCGKCRVSYSGEPALKLLCHCEDCKKITGSTYSTNAAVPEGNFKVTAGTPKTFTKTADSGNPITSHFCGDCGSTLYRDGPTFPGIKILKAGILDGDALKDLKPAGELYAPERTSWVSEVAGAEQKGGMS